VGRWLAADAIRPWRHRSWIFPRDPDFAAKAARVLDLYDRIWHGQPLGGDEYVLCADEKTQIQALSRCHPDLPPAPGRVRRRRLLGRSPWDRALAQALAAPGPLSVVPSGSGATIARGVRPATARLALAGGASLGGPRSGQCGG
jgi:hypothetical protein